MKILQNISFAEEDVARDVHVEFTMSSDLLDPQALTTELGIVPSRSWAKGESYVGKPRISKDGTTVSVQRIHPWGIWALSTKDAIGLPKRVEAHVMYLVERLEPHKAKLQRYISQTPGMMVRFYIWWEPHDGHGSYEISASTMIKMAELSQFTEFCFFSSE